MNLLENVDLGDSFNDNSQFIQSPTSEFENKFEAEIKNLTTFPPSESEYIQNSTIPTKTEPTIEVIKEIVEEVTTPNLDVHTLVLLWLILSGCNVEDCLLDADAAVNFGVGYPTDQKVLKLLLEAGAVEQTDVDEDCESSRVSLKYRGDRGFIGHP